GLELDTVLFDLTQIPLTAKYDRSKRAVIHGGSRGGEWIICHEWQVERVVCPKAEWDACLRLRRHNNEGRVERSIRWSSERSACVRKVFDPILVGHVIIGNAQLQAWDV